MQKQSNKKLKKISKELFKASKMHKGQADRIGKIVKEQAPPGGAPQGGMSMGAKIGIGVGAVAVLGVIIWAIVSASKNKS